MNYIDRLNKRLSSYTDITILSLSPEKAILSNGKTLDGVADVRKLKRRITNNSVEFLSRFNKIYSTNTDDSINAEKEAKRATSRLGGIAVQKKHGKKIKQNLNTGEPWNKGTSGNYPYEPWSKGKTKHNSKTLAKLSNDRTGNGNPMYGKTVTQETRELISKIMKNKILTGEFTPNSNNRNTRWDSTYNNKQYRSSWEALCQYVYPDADYESLRIEYVHDGGNKIYIVDFVDHVQKLVIEVKPVEFQTGIVYDTKIDALSAWCEKHDYSLIVFDQTYIKNIKILTEHLQLFDDNTLRKLQAVK